MMSLILGAFLFGFAGFAGTTGSAVIVPAGSIVTAVASSVFTFFGRPLFRGTGMSTSPASSRLSELEWNCLVTHNRGRARVFCSRKTLQVFSICIARILRRGMRESFVVKWRARLSFLLQNLERLTVEP